MCIPYLFVPERAGCRVIKVGGILSGPGLVLTLGLRHENRKQPLFNSVRRCYALPCSSCPSCP